MDFHFLIILRQNQKIFFIVMKLFELLSVTFSIVSISLGVAGGKDEVIDPYGSQRWQDTRDFDRFIAKDERRREIDKRKKEVAKRIKKQQLSETILNEWKWKEDQECSVKVMEHYALQSISKLSDETTDGKKNISFSVEFITPDNEVAMKGEYKLFYCGKKGKKQIQNITGTMSFDNSKTYPLKKSFDLNPAIIAEKQKGLKIFNLLMSMLAIKEGKDDADTEFDTTEPIYNTFNTQFDKLIENMQDYHLFKLPSLSESSGPDEHTLLMMQDLFEKILAPD